MINVSLKTLLDISLEAGREILNVYERDYFVETKGDGSPLTAADQRSHQAIIAGLQNVYGEIPILSEEGRKIPYAKRKEWSVFFLVDPLDGTKEFIKKNGEFTVNIALIEGGYPVMGIIYVPVLDTFYFGKTDLGAFKLEGASRMNPADDKALIEQSVQLPITAPSDIVKVIASRSHMSEETEAFIEELRNDHTVNVVSAGSSLKFCLVAEGKADYYPRYAPTMEWDTAAGQAIVEAAGGTMLRYEDNERFYYNRKNLKNGWFFVKR
ncbi:3'(2'),5'-bisphosphate nucleotidase CysQ [Oceanobacillus jeddahense]|uniref:3'(2'),5'-bisphosphate nucleotidase CysQ n=1 Tax=Oceanobacillus jeddahense TaxID=1462527 RepID=A0ABY5JXF8_9BACI|nr:3'(2'),5'-bisphosphate nucleotidase CysQ [Oceanobacillus jeddahense]UUI05016.1 3'(2'),5'-bisphosphate nucleotidase CysQ [Oceanobacillus jeddahense]